MKYRIPILHRCPFIRRVPIMGREPVIIRSTIFTRKAISTTLVKYDGCCIGDNYADCNGCPYCKAESCGENLQDPVLILIDKPVNDWKLFTEQIVFAKYNKRLLRVVTDIPLPRDILYEIGYSPFNVVQYNFNMSMSNSDLMAFKTSMMIASNCGLYIAILLYPVLPGVIRVYDIIELLDGFKNICKQVCLKFIESDLCFTPVNGFYNINGNPVPEWTIQNGTDGICCSDIYIAKFVDSLKRYIIPRKINVSICNQKICY